MNLPSPDLLSSGLLGTELESLGRILNPLPEGATRLREGENRFVAILFMDLKGFTELGERLHSEDVQQILDRVLTVFTNSIERYSGYIDKYEGDLIMALFGSRNAGEQDTEHALLAGLKMLRDLPEVNRLLGTDLHIRIGVNTGLVTTGRVGKKREGDFTVYGDAVNVASRLESSAPLDSILVTAETHQLVGDRFLFTDRGELEVKGKSRPLHVYTVERPLEKAPLALAPSSGSPFVGRRAERARLLEGWQRCCADHIRGGLWVFEITAAAGLGKTRLVEEFLRDLVGSGQALVPMPLRIAPGSTGSGAGSLWRSLLLRVFGLEDGLAGDPLRERLRAGLSALPDSCHGDPDPARADLLGLLLGLPWPGGPEDAAGLAARLAVCLRRLLEALALASPQPLALFCEDLHRADELGLALLSHLVENWNRDRDPAKPGGGLFLIALKREDVATGLSVHSCVTSLNLGPLEEAECHALLAGLLGGKRPPGELAGLLLPRAQGNPLVLHELLSLLRERDLLVEREGAWLLREESRRLPLPRTLNQLLLSRVDLLDPEPKRALHCAAVLGAPFERNLLVRCLRELEGTGKAEDTVDFLVRSGWLQPDTDGLRLHFGASLVEDVCYSTLLRHNRRLIHGLAARVAGQTGSGDPEHLARVARHHDEADQAPEALDWLERAWHAGAFRGEPRRRLELGLRLRARLGGDTGRAGRTLPAALALELAGLQESLGQWGEALATLDHGEPGHETDILVLRGRLKALLGDREGARSDLAAALERAEQDGDTPGQARALVELARLARIRGHLPQAIALYEQSLAALTEVRSPDLEADALMGLGSCRRAVGDSSGSRQALEKARNLYTEIRDLRGLSGCLQSLGDLSRLAGDLAGARQAYRQALSHSLSLGLREREAAVRRSLGDLLLVAGDREDAAAELAASLALFGELGDLHGRAVVLRSQGHLKRLGGDAPGARECFTQSRSLRHLLGDARGEALALTDLAQLEADGGDLPRAIRLAGEALELFTVQGQRTAAAQCLRALGDYRLRLGLRGQAEQDYRRALELCDALQDPRGAAFCLLGLAESCAGPLPEALRERLTGALAQFDHPTHDSLRERARRCLDSGNTSGTTGTPSPIGSV